MLVGLSLRMGWCGKMHRGVPQIPDTPQSRQARWNNSNEREKREYTQAMEQWKKDFPTSAEILDDETYPGNQEALNRGAL